MAYKQPSSGSFKMMGSTPAKQKKTKGFGPRASKGSDDQSKELAVSKFEMGEYKNDPTGTYKPKAEVQDDKALDRAEDARGVGTGSNRKVMKDGEVNETQKKKIADAKAKYDALSDEKKKKLQEERDQRRKDFEASDEYKKRKEKR